MLIHQSQGNLKGVTRSYMSYIIEQGESNIIFDVHSKKCHSCLQLNKDITTYFKKYRFLKKEKKSIGAK